MSAVFYRKLGPFLAVVLVTWGLIVGLHTPRLYPKFLPRSG